jgi:GTP cyclohydrolase IA
LPPSASTWHPAGLPRHPPGWRAYAELLTPREFTLTTFDNDEGYDELVVTRDIPIRSVCEHHMLPLVGVAHVGYLPGERIVGLSKLARVVELFAHGPQLQERLTRQIAVRLNTQLRPGAVGVVIEAEHLCMTMRSVQAAGARSITCTLLGLLRDDPPAPGISSSPWPASDRTDRTRRSRPHLAGRRKGQHGKFYP